MNSPKRLTSLSAASDFCRSFLLDCARSSKFLGAPIIDFSHLTPDERIELAEQLWDSLEPGMIGPDDAQLSELRRRRATLEADRNPGEPWEQVLDEIAKRGV